jgi:hypothetical protein
MKISFQAFFHDISTMSAPLAALVVYCSASWPLVLKIVGSNPAEAVGFFRQKNPQHVALTGHFSPDSVLQ